MPTWSEHSEQAGWALVFPVKHSPISWSWLEAAVTVHKLSQQDPEGRQVVVEAWNAGLQPFKEGLWAVFSMVPHQLRLHCVQGGRLESDTKSMLDLDMCQEMWMHQSRLLVRHWWLHQSGYDHIQLQELDLRAADRMAGKVSKDSHNSARTMILSGFLTGALQQRLFGDSDCVCEHCGQFDNQLHRVISCPATEPGRNQFGISENDLRHLLSGRR